MDKEIIATLIKEVIQEMNTDDKELAEAQALKDKELAEAQALKDKELAEAQALKDKELAEAQALKDKELAEAQALKDKEKEEIENPTHLNISAHSSFATTLTEIGDSLGDNNATSPLTEETEALLEFILFNYDTLETKVEHLLNQGE